MQDFRQAVPGFSIVGAALVMQESTLQTDQGQSWHWQDRDDWYHFKDGSPGFRGLVLTNARHSVISESRNLRQEDCHKLETCLDYIVRP